MNIGFVEILSSKVSNPKVTIAIPTYLRADLLQEAIESAINQVFDDEYEIIVVDNNPERHDETEIAMERYHNVSNLAYYKNSENLGMMGNWNRLYELSKGKYVAMLHDDDILYDNYLSILDRLMRYTNETFSFIYPSIYHTRNRQIPNGNTINKIDYRICKPQDFIAVPLGIPSGMVLEKAKFGEIGDFTMDYYPISDQDFNFRALLKLKGCRIIFPQTVLYYMGGQNESCKSDTTRKFVHSINAFYKTFYDRLAFPWSVLSIFTRRDLVNSMIKWWTNFGSAVDLHNAQEEIGWRRNNVKDLFSKFVRNILRLYIKVFRKRTISLD